MHTAVDAFTEKPVQASEVSTCAVAKKFLCPCCRTEVAFVKAGLYQAHFRHIGSTDHKDCEQYVTLDGTGVSRFLLTKDILRKRQLLLGIAVTQSRIIGSFDWQPYVRFRPHDGVRSIRGVRPKSPPLVTIAGRPVFLPVESIEAEYHFQIESWNIQSAEVKVDGFCREVLLFTHSFGFWALVDPEREISPGEYVVLSKSEIQAGVIPEEIQIVRGGENHGFHALHLVLHTDLTEDMVCFCRERLLHELVQIPYEYAIFCDGYVPYLGEAAWRVPPGKAVTLLLKSNLQNAPHMVFERAGIRNRSIEKIESPTRWTMLSLGELPTGRHVLASVNPEQIIAVLEVPEHEEELRVHAVQMNIEQGEKNNCYYWSSDRVVKALEDVRSGQAQVTHLLLPHGFYIEGRSDNGSSRPQRIGKEQELNAFLRENLGAMRLQLFATNPLTAFPSIFLSAVIPEDKLKSQRRSRSNRITPLSAFGLFGLSLEEVFRNGGIPNRSLPPFSQL